MKNKLSRNFDVLGCNVRNTTYSEVCELIHSQIVSEQWGYVCVANVHMIMVAFDDPNYKKIVNSAFVTTPDGIPLVLAIRLLGGKDSSRVYGPKLMEQLFKFSEQEGFSIGFLGGSEKTINCIKNRIVTEYPKLNIDYLYSPDYFDEPYIDINVINAINKSNIKILFVGLGCPKQEKWMNMYQTKIKAIMVGVGAAFDFYSKQKRQAPLLLQKIGLEWFYRFLMEPKRLWKRYIFNNPRFVIYFLYRLIIK